MTNKEFIDYMQICGRLDLSKYGDEKTKINIDIFRKSRAEVWKYWILLESIEMPVDIIFYAMRLMIEHKLKDHDIKILIENMRLMSRTIVLSWYEICKKFEESLIKNGSAKKIYINNLENLPIIINDEYITIDWKDSSFELVDIIIEDDRKEDIKCLLIKSDTEYKLIRDNEDNIEDMSGLEVYFEKRRKIWKNE